MIVPVVIFLSQKLRGLPNRAVCGPARGPHLARGPAVFGGPQPARADFWVARIGPQLKFGFGAKKFVKNWQNSAKIGQK